MILESEQKLTYRGDKKPSRLVSKYTLQKATDKHMYISENRYLQEIDNENNIEELDEEEFICIKKSGDAADDFIRCCLTRINNNYIYFPSNTRQIVSINFKRD